jgi:alkylation response protein AidB-like acyl-CoA dehydrogenase
MDLRFTPEEEAFRVEIRSYLDELLNGEFAIVKGRGGPGDADSCVEERLAWERRLGRDGWTCVGWPKDFGGRGLSLTEQVIYFEEYARAGGPGRLGHIGEGLIGPTLINFGTPAQQARFLPAIRAGEEIWCQGYSEPNAGSDLAGLTTRAVRDGDDFVITGQKVWTSLAQMSDWCFVLARTDPDAPRHHGISFLLISLRTPGIEIRPIVQLTGTAEFNEIFFTEARTPADLVVGEVNGGWAVAMALLSFERGTSTLGQQFAFEQEFEAIVALARANGRSAEPSFRARAAGLWSRLQIMRWNTLRTLSTGADPTLSGPGYIVKLYWSRLHQDLGELFLETVGDDALVLEGDPPGLSDAQRLYLFSRADSIYAGSDQIQRNIIGERCLGLPRETPATATKG